MLLLEGVKHWTEISKDTVVISSHSYLNIVCIKCVSCKALSVVKAFLNSETVVKHSYNFKTSQKTDRVDLPRSVLVYVRSSTY